MNSRSAIGLALLLIIAVLMDGLALTPGSATSLPMTVFVALYFAPVALATIRGRRHTGAIWVVDTFFGWTIIGWVIALAMAATGDTLRELKAA